MRDKLELLLEIDEVGPLGDGTMIYERSHYTMYKENKEVFDAGKLVQNT